jgi:transposase-like protein
MIRNSTKFVSYKDLKKVCVDLKTVYSANSGKAGREALEEFGKIWNGKYLMIYQPRRRRWNGLNEFFRHPPETRRAVYTADAVESMNYQLSKVTKNRPSFSTGGAEFKILYLAVRNALEKRTMPIRDWGRTLNQVDR